MTPPAATAAAKSKPKRPTAVRPANRSSGVQTRAPAAPGRRPPAKRNSRGTAPRTRSARAPSRTPRVPRRVSGPARRPPLKRTVPLLQVRPVPVLGALGVHAARAGRSLPESALFDRLLRGRVWIALLGVLLIGLVALNVSLLKLNAEAGRNAEIAKGLRIRNAQLRAKVSRLASGERLQRAGRDMGLRMSIAGRVRYLSIGQGDARRAARALRLPGSLGYFAFAPIPEPAPLSPPPVQPAPAATTSPPASPNLEVTPQPTASPPPTVPADAPTNAPVDGGTQPLAGTTPPAGE